MPISEETRLRYEQMNERRAKFGLPPEELPEDEPVRPVRRLKAVPPAKPKNAPPTAATAIATNAIESNAIATPPTPAIAGIIAGDKWTGIPNDILDNVLRALEPFDQVVLIRLYRLSWGFKRDWCEVSGETLAKGCNISKRQVNVSIPRLEARGLIKRIKTGRTETAKYRMLLPPAIAKNAIATTAIAENADSKDKALNKKDIKSPTNEDRMTAEELAAHMEKLSRGEEE